MTFNAVVLVFWGVEQLSRGVLTPVKIRLLILNIRLKGQSNEIIDLQFFSSFELAWTTDQWVKIFSILVKISPSYSICITLRGVWNCAGYDTARSQSPRSIILQKVMWLFWILFKGTFQQDFWPPVFIIWTWATGQWVKIFSILVKISPSYSNFS